MYPILSVKQYGYYSRTYTHTVNTGVALPSWVNQLSVESLIFTDSGAKAKVLTFST